MGKLEAKADRLNERSERSLFADLEAARKAAGMKPKEMYEIFETKGIEELFSEIRRRLDAKRPTTHS
jgi:hypothetical protein